MFEKSIGIDKFKERTLACLQSKREGQRTYPIDESDLQYVHACPLCGSGPPVVLTEVYLPDGLNFFSTAVCERCLFTFRNVSPGHLWFKRCWAMISTKKKEVFNPAIEEIRRARYADYFKLLSSHAHDGIVLDLGAGYGTGARLFRDNGCRVEAVEADDDKAYYIQECLNIPVYHTSIEEFLERRRQYRLVLFSHCLEHLDDPVGVLRGIRDIVDPERGIVYLEVPTLWESVSWSDALYLTHKSNFTEENIIDLARWCGFEVLEQVRYRATPEEPLDLGLILKPAGGASGGTRAYRTSEGRDVMTVAELYRRKLPVPAPPATARLRYGVPYIEHFYQTLRLDGKRLRQDENDPATIFIEPE